MGSGDGDGDGDGATAADRDLLPLGGLCQPPRRPHSPRPS